MDSIKVEDIVTHPLLGEGEVLDLRYAPQLKKKKSEDKAVVRFKTWVKKLSLKLLQKKYSKIWQKN